MDNKRIYLAPMVGRTDEHYRSFVRILSKNIYLYTEMITCDSFLHTNRKNYVVKEGEKNLTIQLAGSDPKKYGQCASIIEEQGYDEINLNIGCPSSKVVKGEFGAYLMNNPEKVADCVYEIKKSCDLPVSIKTRLGLGYEENLDLLFTLINKFAICDVLHGTLETNRKDLQRNLLTLVGHAESMKPIQEYEKLAISVLEFLEYVEENWEKLVQ